MPKSFERPTKELPKMLEISGDTVGEATLEVCPNEFVGIKLRRIAGKMKGLKSNMSFKEFANELGTVERASVPKKEDCPPKMPTKVPEKLLDLSGSDVFVGMESSIESQSVSLGRDSDGRNGRDFCPASGNGNSRSFSFSSPSFLNVGDERKPALIQEYQVGSKPTGLFLYEAKRDTSNNEWLAPCVPWLSSVVFGSSTPENPSDSISSRYRVEPGISCARSDLCVSKSKDPLKNLLPGDLPPVFSSGFSSASLKETVLVPNAVSLSSRPRPSCDRPVASVLRNSGTLPLFRPLSGACVLFSTTERPVDAGLPMFEGCHEVSSYPPRLPPLYRPEFVSINR